MPEHPAGYDPALNNKMMSLAMSFPCLAVNRERWAPAGRWDWQAMRRFSRACSSGEKQAARFILWVFNRYDHKFDFQEAVLVWGRAERAAFSAWLVEAEFA